MPSVARLPRLKRPHRVGVSDTPEALLARLTELGSNPTFGPRLLARLRFMLAIARNCETLEEAASRTAMTESLGMQIRQFHNDLELHVHRHCFGALYRSAGVVALAEKGQLSAAMVHCEHTIPSNVIAGMIFSHFRERDEADLGAFLLRETIVTACTREERHNHLELRTEHNGRVSGWGKTHPDYDRTTVPGDGTRRPFLRYVGKGVDVYPWVGEQIGSPIDLANFTMQDHWRNLDSLELFDITRTWARVA